MRGWGGIFSPGAPGFPYVFNMPNKPHSPPIILVAGDCTGSAYIFTPVQHKIGESTEKRQQFSFINSENQVAYELAFEVECGATVGSAAVAEASDGSGDVMLYIPSYELNKVHVFRLTEN